MSLMIVFSSLNRRTPALISPVTLQILIRKEDEAEVQQFKAFLGKERRLQRLFQCLCDGISKPNALAQKLKLRVRAVNTLRQRLQRRLTDFFTQKTSAEIGVQRKKV